MSNRDWGDDDDDFDDDEFDYKSNGYGRKGHQSSQPNIRSKFFTDICGDIKTITEFRTDDSKGETTKFIRKLRIVKKAVKIKKAVLKRRKLPKFGDCKGAGPGPEDGVTMPQIDSVELVLRCRKKEDDVDDDDPMAKLGKSVNDSVVICRNCGEQGHWTLKCPKRNTIAVTMKDGTAITNAPNSSRGAFGSGGSGKYIPVHRREGAAATRGSSMRRDDSATVRVFNISEDTTEDDLRELFRPFGYVTRIYLGRDPYTRISRGFAFVSYSSRKECQAAIDKLNGHGYDNLILGVGFAKPRES